MPRFGFRFLVWLVCGAISVAPFIRAAGLSDAGFQQPPRSARPLIYWNWMKGCVDRDGITADLEAMHRIGLAGPQLFTIAGLNPTVNGPVKFLGDDWRALLRHTVDECRRLGLEFSIENAEGWGQAGGAWVTPAESMQRLVWSETEVEGGRSLPLAIPRPVPEPEYYEDIALLAFPTPAGDEDLGAPKISPSARLPETAAKSRKAPAAATAGHPRLLMPMPMPGRPQWVRLDFPAPRTFRSFTVAIEEMRDVADPERWEQSPYLDRTAREVLAGVAGPHYWELQVSDNGKDYRPLTRVSTHGTTCFPAVTAQYFRIWMPVPPPLQLKLPFSGDEPMQITEIGFGGARLDRAELRAGKYVDASVREFTGQQERPECVIDRTRIVDLTGRATWEAPPGRWTLLRVGHASSHVPVAAGAPGSLEGDRLSREVVTASFTRGTIAPVLADVGAAAGETFTHILCDSWERGYETWTPSLPAEFARRRGYPLDAWLPALTGRVVDSVEASERFLWDFRRTIADLVADNFYGTLDELAHEHHLGVRAEAAGHGLPGIVDQLMCKGRVDVPCGEFWVGHGEVDDTKEAASAAHIYGRPVAGAEAFTSAPELAAWTQDPYSLKARGDLVFCLGINRFNLHRSVHQPWADRQPGMTLGAWGTEFDRTNTWWEPSAAWVEYLSRCQYLLQQGQFVADLCYFYGEDAPMDFHFERLRPALPAGYDFDVCNAEILARMTVRDGRIVLPGGMSYRVLVLPDHDRMSPAVIRIVQRLVQAGATIVGPRPAKSPSLTGFPACDQTVQTIATEVWGDTDGRTKTMHASGQGRMIWGGSLAAAIGVAPDFSSDQERLKYIHRRDGETEIYFVSNQAAAEITAQCTFRVRGLVPELWHPDTGRRETCAMYSKNGDSTTLPVHFDPAGSVFVVFRQPERGSDPLVAASPALAEPPVLVEGVPVITAWAAGSYAFTTAQGRHLAATVAALPAPVELAGPWRVEFPPRLGAPAVATFDQLHSWADDGEAGVKFFSGTATYVKEFTRPATAGQADRRLFLDLGTVKNLCRVKLNGQDLGVLWKPPFRVDVTSALRPGANRLELEVTNLWPNRLIGDQQLPEAQRVTWTTSSPYKADSPLLPSGLLGPVVLRTAAEIRLAR